MTTTRKVAISSPPGESWLEAFGSVLAKRGWEATGFDAGATDPFDGVVGHVSELPHRPVEEAEPASWEERLQANLEPLLGLLDRALPTLAENASVVAVLPRVAFNSGAGTAEAAAAAGAAVGLLRSLAAELGPDGVRVNGIAIGPETDVASIANAVAFLACDADYVTGEILRLPPHDA